MLIEILFLLVTLTALYIKRKHIAHFIIANTKYEDKQMKPNETLHNIPLFSHKEESRLREIPTSYQFQGILSSVCCLTVVETPQSENQTVLHFMTSNRGG